MTAVSVNVVIFLGWLNFYWYFYLKKLTQAVWFDPDKKLYTMEMFYRLEKITFKAGQLTEINDLFATLNIRGMKVYCPKEFFFREESYHEMLKKKSHRSTS